MDLEQSVPTLFSFLILLAASALLAEAARSAAGRGAEAWRWRLLSATFAFLAVDEILSLHEALTGPMQRTFDTSGPLLFAWIIPYSLGVLALAVLYLPWLRTLPSAVSGRMVIAAALFLGGALGIEMVGAAYVEPLFAAGVENFRTPEFLLITMFEEGLEMSGVIVFISALHIHLAGRHDRLQVSVSMR